MIPPAAPTGKPVTKRYTNIVVLTRVRIMSDGGYWFHVVYRDNRKAVKRDYQIGVGFDGIAPYPGLWEHPPQYLEAEVRRQIAEKLTAGTFVFYEHDADGNERTADLRYRDTEREQWIIEVCSRD